MRKIAAWGIKKVEKHPDAPEGNPCHGCIFDINARGDTCELFVCGTGIFVGVDENGKEIETA